MTEFTNRGWKMCSISRLLQKLIKDDGTVVTVHRDLNNHLIDTWAGVSQKHH